MTIHIYTAPNKTRHCNHIQKSRSLPCYTGPDRLPQPRALPFSNLTISHMPHFNAASKPSAAIQPRDKQAARRRRRRMCAPREISETQPTNRMHTYYSHTLLLREAILLQPRASPQPRSQSRTRTRPEQTPWCVQHAAPPPQCRQLQLRDSCTGATPCRVT